MKIFEDFLKSYKQIQGSKFLNKESKLYLQNKFQEKHKWVKAFMKSQFCGGMCTTSRVESKHRVFKRYLKSSTSLCQLFNVIRNLENQEINSFVNEIEKIGKKSSNNLEKSNFIKYFKQNFSEYIIVRLKNTLIESTNYKVKEISKNIWYIIYIL